MKRLYLISLTLVLLLAQLGSLEHVYHEHNNSEVCDYCLSAQPLDHAVTTPVQSFLSQNNPQWYDGAVTVFITVSDIQYYAARAPPQFI